MDAQVVDLNLNFLNDDTLSGFRLIRLDVLNWGTFDQRIGTLTLKGKNGLLTGDIGSGKSTLVDAITTLLVPSQKIAYNKAAGAETRERTLRSYVLGHYKQERSEESGKAKPAGLRETDSHSVILAVFYNAGYNQTITLAQVFWFKEPQGQPSRFFVGMEGELSIAADFTNFGPNIAFLKKRLKGEGAELFDTFPPYGAYFRRRFGIENEQALELFHQTVSMKSVGNLTDFVRNHMLEPFNVEGRIKALMEHFDDLNRAHEAVRRARLQVEHLTPLIADCDRHAAVLVRWNHLSECREALKAYFAKIKLGLLEKRLERLAEELESETSALDRLERRAAQQRSDQSEIKQSIAENGGNRLDRLAEEIRRKQEEQQNRRKKAERYEELTGKLGLAVASDDGSFIAGRNQLIERTQSLAEEENRNQNRRTEEEVAFSKLREELQKLTDEIRSLKDRRNNIPAEQIALRKAICQALRKKEDDMPFVGELIKVREEDVEWEGAAERMLRNFGLSLIVPDEHYAKVAEWVDQTHLRGRLVYFRVRKAQRSERLSLPPSNALARKLEIKNDSPFYDWLEREIAHRFDLVCCDTQEQFRREEKAITRSGQIKAKGERHEKDDRHRIDDRSRFVLGWTNTAKIAVLEQSSEKLKKAIQESGLRISGLEDERRNLSDLTKATGELHGVTEFREIDWQSINTELIALQNEKAQIEAASDILKELSRRLRSLEGEMAITEQEGKAKHQHIGGLHAKKEAAAKLKEETLEFLALQNKKRTDDEKDETSGIFTDLEKMQAEAIGEKQITIESCDNREHDMRVYIQSRIDAENARLSSLRDAITRKMIAFKDKFPSETQETDAAMEAQGEYRAMLERLTADDLPRFEAHFKQLLNENTIREVANFQSQLAMEKERIKERIERINDSLTRIDYNPGRFIRLEAQPTLDVDIRDFQNQLRSCTEGSLVDSAEESYTESRFTTVKEIIERFRGREGSAESDRRWTTRVTDVRNWFVFAASERWREDKTEYEHYSDSGGKSGGQKEKLAYTVLAASLAYQFGLEWGSVRSRSFRFVVIDEAFGRGSDDSTRYGLKLFSELNLQLLIVTPLQKIHIIEPYVSSVGFVSNVDGRSSRLRNLTVEEYREEKARKKA